jgi:hypothetical protein
MLRMRSFSDKVLKIKRHILYSITLFRKSCCFLDNVENSGYPNGPQCYVIHILPLWFTILTHFG